MSIGLSYTHESVAGGIVLPNYIYLLHKYHPLSATKLFSGDAEETKKFLQYVEGGVLQEVLGKRDAEMYFEAPGIREILQVAYPYEIAMKCLGKEVQDDADRNERLIHLFNNFFDTDYHRLLKTYIKTCDRGGSYQYFLESRGWRYNDRDAAVQLYLNFLDALFRSQGYIDEANRLADFTKHHLYINSTPGISGITTEKRGNVYIEVGNNTYTTLFHELTHFVNRFFRYHYYENNEVCFDHFTRTNEGLSNFVAYHLHQQIIQQDLTQVEHMDTGALFFSSYIDIYATLTTHGSNTRKHNIDIITHELQIFEGDLLTPQKLDFYIQRFYKFFHYDQHTYFYPKEMMYYVGYHDIRELFATSNDKTQLLTQCLLGKVCL